MICEWLKTERKRLGLNQEALAAAAGVTRRAYAEWEGGKTSPTAVQLSGMAAVGADIRYLVTGVRQGDGIGETAVHQAVLDAVDLLSLEKKVDAQQLAKAVVKLCQRAAPPAPDAAPTYSQSVTSNSGQVTQSGDITIKAPTSRSKKK